MTDYTSARQLAAQYAKAEDSNPLNGVSPQQAKTWVENNVNDLATAKDALVQVAGLLALYSAYFDRILEILTQD